MVSGAKPPSHRSAPVLCGARGSRSDEASSPGSPSGIGSMPSFFNGIVGPFMACWQPPFEACVTPSQPMTASVGASPMSIDAPYSLSPQSSSVVALTSNIRTPHANDVLCGRGGSSNWHVGNLNFRALVAMNKDTYVSLTKKQKMTMARSIVNTVRGQDPPGRFLQKATDTGLWSDIGMPRSLQKTSQALREKTISSDKELISADASVASEHLDDEVRSPFPVVPSHTTPISSPSKAVSPLTTPKSRKSAPPPLIKIPEHLKEQFNPYLRRQRMVQRRPAAPRSGGWAVPPVMPHSPQQPYLPSYQRSSLKERAPPVPYTPPPMYPHSPYGHPVDHNEFGLPRLNRSHGARPQPPHAYPPQLQPPPMLAATIPPSPPRLAPSLVVTPSRAPDPNSQRSGSRKGQNISPARQQGSKRRRQGSPPPSQMARTGRSQSESSLSQHMQVGLNLNEDLAKKASGKDLPSPSRVLQSRVRPRRSVGDESAGLAGLAALSSAALLKLHEVDK